MAYLLDKSGIITVSNQLRAKGNKIIFTHGTFDLFHFGHLDFLKRSKKEGDILVVGVDSDERTRHYKGVNRPFLSEDHRSKLLQGINVIDFVFVLSEENKWEEKYYIDLYKKLNPNVVTYGRNFDYKKQYMKKENKITSVTYSEILTSNFVGLSSTDIIKKISSAQTGK